MSEQESEKKPVIVVKKNKKHDGHHGGAWKVAYADFVTAMMAFFLVMWLVNQSDSVKQAVQGYFLDPVGYSDKHGHGVLEGGTAPIEGKTNRPMDIETRLELEREMLSNVGLKIRSAIEVIPELSGISQFVEIEMTGDGLRIQLIDASKDAESNFFDLGSANLKPRAGVLLEAISSELAKLENYIVIEGHTDSRPYTARRDYTNWELSADRANSARKLMENAGLRPGQVVEIRGFADRMPRLENSPEDPRNRRVSIIVLDEETAKQYRAT